MLKFLVILILIIGAAFGIPRVREKIMPPLLPLLEKLGPVGDKLQAPVKKWAASNEAHILLRKLAADYGQNKELPSPLRFQIWIKQNTRGGKGGMDPWGRPYYMIHRAHELVVGSPGPDRIRNTADDVRASAPLGN
jgi:hypothetical protein